jgi:hypothetical protein
VTASGTLTLLSPRNLFGQGDDKRWLLIVGSAVGHRRFPLYDAQDVTQAMEATKRILGYAPRWQPVVTVEGWPPAWTATQQKRRKKAA